MVGGNHSFFYTSTPLGKQKNTSCDELCFLVWIRSTASVQVYLPKRSVHTERWFGAHSARRFEKPPIHPLGKQKSTSRDVLFLLVERGGFEPPKSLTTDLQSAPFGHSGTSPYGAGDRNRTNNLLITNQLLCLLSYTSVLSCWCLGADSNHRHRDFQSLALPPELPRHTGFQSPF